MISQPHSRQRRAFQAVGAMEHLSAHGLEMGTRLVEAITPDGAIDLALMTPEFQEIFERSMRKKVEGLTRVQRAFALPQIIDSRDPRNRDPLGLKSPTAYPPETTQDMDRGREMPGR